MNSEELRKMQGPIKEQYRNHPETAIVTLKASGEIGEGISCKIDTGRALVEAGLHPATGGDGTQICSGDLLLEALVACAGVTLRAVATVMGVVIKNGSVRAEGELDFRGTLGVSKEAPVGFKAIRLNFIINTDTTPEQFSSIAKLTERYCVVYQTLTKGVLIESSFKKK